MKFPAKPFVIFTFDGGGVRGVLSASLLEQIEIHRPAVLGLVDMYAGTSTGSIIASSLALGMSPAKIRAAYERLAPAVFRGGFFKSLPVIGNIFYARYTNHVLRRELARVFGRVKLGDLPRKILIPAFDMDGPANGAGRPRSWRPKFFNNFQSNDLDIDLVDVILSSTAAPTYFPAWQRYIDGGVAANNPSMAALAQAIDAHTGRQHLSNIILLSCGTGQTPAFIQKRNVAWGWLPWVKYLIDIMLDGNVSIADYQVKRLLDEQYFRLNPLLTYPARIDDLQIIPLLRQTASQYDAQPLFNWLDLNLESFYDRSSAKSRGRH